MESQVRLLIVSHAVALFLVAVAGFLLQGWMGTLSIVVGLTAFSLPVIAFSLLVLRAASKNPQRFWGRFMAAEVLKWSFSALLLAIALVLKVFLVPLLLAGFFVSLLVQLVYPILLKRGSES